MSGLSNNRVAKATNIQMEDVAIEMFRQRLGMMKRVC